MVEVGGNQRQLVVAENAFEFGAFGSFKDDLVNFFNGCRALSVESKVSNGNVQCRNTHGVTVKLAFQLGDNNADSLSGTGLSRDDVVSSGAGAAQIFVLNVGKNLVVCEGVDGGHHAVNNAEFVHQRLNERAHAVGGAGSVGNDNVACLKNVLVHAVNNGSVNVFAGSGNQNFLGAGFDVLHCAFFIAECAGAFENDVDVQIFPRKLLRITFGAHENTVSVYDQMTVVPVNVAVELAVRCVELGQMNGGFGLSSIVNGNDLNVRPFLFFIKSAEDVATDAAVTGNSYSNSHVYFP